jgi:hypothetical protein
MNRNMKFMLRQHPPSAFRIENPYASPMSHAEVATLREFSEALSKRTSTAVVLSSCTHRPTGALVSGDVSATAFVPHLPNNGFRCYSSKFRPSSLDFIIRPDLMLQVYRVRFRTLQYASHRMPVNFPWDREPLHGIFKGFLHRPLLVSIEFHRSLPKPLRQSLVYFNLDCFGHRNERVFCPI